jgi:transposase
MTHDAGLDVSRRPRSESWMSRAACGAGTAPTGPEALTQLLHRHGCELLVGVETDSLMPSRPDC